MRTVVNNGTQPFVCDSTTLTDVKGLEFSECLSKFDYSSIGNRAGIKAESLDLRKTLSYILQSWVCDFVTKTNIQDMESNSTLTQVLESSVRDVITASKINFFERRGHTGQVFEAKLCETCTETEVDGLEVP